MTIIVSNLSRLEKKAEANFLYECAELKMKFLAGIIQSEFTPLEAQMFLIGNDLPKDEYILFGFKIMSKYLYFHGFELVSWQTIEEFLVKNNETEDAAFPDDRECSIENPELQAVVSGTIEFLKDNKIITSEDDVIKKTMDKMSYGISAALQSYQLSNYVISHNNN